jgi:hypothetical protein
MSLRPPLPRTKPSGPKPIGAPKAGPIRTGKPPAPGAPGKPGAPKKPC